MLELWKPLLVLKDKNNPVLFDITGNKFSEEPINNFIKPEVDNNHPFVIFYDDKEDCYYYLKARGAWDYNKDKLKPKYNPFEIEIQEEVIGLFKKRTYVDCSQIFKCERQLLESLVDCDCELYKKTRSMRDVDVEDIKNLLFEAIMKIPPYLSIVEIKVDDQGNTYGESLYLCEQKINEKFDLANLLGVDFNEEYEQELLDLKSNKNDIRSRVKNRFNNGINFCIMFLNEYFPNELEDFTKKQELNNSKGKEL